MNLKNINNKTIGLFFSLSLIIPSNYGLDLSGINFEDIPIIIIFILLLFKKISNFSLLVFDRVFISFFISFVLYSNIFTKNFQLFNQTNIRFYFYFLLGYLCVDTIKTSSKGIIEIFEPLSIVMVANFIISMLQVQLPGTIDGWIRNNTASSNPFTSGRLGGFQGGGPNVIGIICAIYVLVCIYKVLNSNNFIGTLLTDKLNTVLLTISILNLYLTYSRGSYIALFIGSLIILFYTDSFNKKTKQMLTISIVFLSAIMIYTFPSIFLKQSNRSFLSNLAINNIEVFIGTGGGNYIKEVYEEYLITLSDEELLNRFNIKYSETVKNSYPQSKLPKSDEDTEGYLKLSFDYKDGVLPRSVISFYHSTDGSNWNQIGSQHTSGLVINLIENDSYFEVGGWGDGQSPGGSYLDGFVKEVQIKVDNKNLEYEFSEENRDQQYFIFISQTNDFYDNKNDGKIIFTEDGIKLKRPRSYWIAIPNQNKISEKDFEVILQVKLNNIPKGNETLFSQSSIINNSDLVNDQSWKWSIIDGRMYFFWVEDVTSGYSNFLGGQSLRSGRLISENGQFNSIISDFSLSQYDEITTSHNGFLTMGVEYGLLPVLVIITSLILIIYKNLGQRNQLELSIFFAFLTQNLTNDLVYSPDVAIYFWIIPTYLMSKVFKD
tara:strand:+ start:379 stop:2358 length:1980 start_codon:yes stop_codon:yes gene_type:complete